MVMDFGVFVMLSGALLLGGLGVLLFVVSIKVMYDIVKEKVQYSCQYSITGDMVLGVVAILFGACLVGGAIRLIQYAGVL